MRIKNKLAFGSVLASFGAISLILNSTLRLTQMGRPWSFIIGFITGLICGLGATLTISGLIEKFSVKTFK